MIPVVLDYSPTVSDAGALLYLAAHPDVDLLAVTLPSTGEAECAPGVRITRALLTIAGRPDVPVGCGSSASAAGSREWPTAWREAANRLPGVLLPAVATENPLDADQLLVDVLGDADERVTVVAVGPLTNLALLFAEHPEAVDQIERVVTMGGAVNVDGNVDSAPAAEWNYYIDPPAARDVLASGVDVLVVPLDATDDMPWTPLLISRLGASTHPVARAEHQIASSRLTLEGIYLWDELAAVAAITPAVVTTETMILAVDVEGALTVEARGYRVNVATAADVDATAAELLRSLNGGTPMVFADLTTEESAYFHALAEQMAAVASGVDMAEPSPSTPAGEAAALIVETMWTTFADVRSGLDELTPPASIDDAHDGFADVLDGALAIEDELLEATGRVDGDGPWGVFNAALREVGGGLDLRITRACADLEAYSLARRGPSLCATSGA